MVLTKVVRKRSRGDSKALERFLSVTQKEPLVLIWLEGEAFVFLKDFWRLEQKGGRTGHHHFRV